MVIAPPKPEKRPHQFIARAAYYKRALSLLAFHGSKSRTQASVLAEYADIGINGVPEWDALNTQALLQEYGHKRLLPLRSIRAAWGDVLASVIKNLEAKEILDVGCGEGVNLGLFSTMYPEIFHSKQWRAFDYALSRTARAATLMVSMKLNNVSVWTGDAKNIDLPSKSADLAYTFHVLEQMPYDWKTALKEMGRVSKYVLLGEPFYERKSFLGKLHSKRNDYFRGTLEEVAALGFEILSVEPLAVQDPFNETTVVLLRASLPNTTITGDLSNPQSGELA